MKRKAKSKMTSGIQIVSPKQQVLDFLLDKSQTNERPVRLMSSAEASPLRVAIELGYQELMVDNVSKYRLFIILLAVLYCDFRTLKC